METLTQEEKKAAWDKLTQEKKEELEEITFENKRNKKVLLETDIKKKDSFIRKIDNLTMSEDEEKKYIENHDCKECASYDKCLDAIKAGLTIKCLFYGKLKMEI